VYLRMVCPTLTSSLDWKCTKKNSQTATHIPNSYILVMHHVNATTHLPFVRSKEKVSMRGAQHVQMPNPS
jgi:hypothetical protein